MKHYQFTIQTQPNLCPLPCEPFKVTIDIEADKLTLQDLAESLISSIGFECDHAFGFYSNLKSAYAPSDEKYTVFSDLGQSEDDEPGVMETLVDDVFSKGKKMLLLFDYGDDWHFLVTCKNVTTASGKSKRTKVTAVKAEGEPPVQYPDFE